jgi:DNA-directed RNA polymerase specialized sigma24 family protein
MPTRAAVAPKGLNEAHYEAALNYFYFLLMDEGSALHSALRAVQAVQKKAKTVQGKEIDLILIKEMASILQKVLKKNQPKSNPAKSDWKTPNAESLASWKDYLRRSEPESAEALVLRYILNYSVKEISKALGVPEGTIHFRLGRGLESFVGGKS